MTIPKAIILWVTKLRHNRLWRGAFQIPSIRCDQNFRFSRLIFENTKKYQTYRSNVHPTDLFEGCRQNGKQKETKRSCLSMNNPFWKLVEGFREKIFLQLLKNSKAAKKRILHNTCFYQTAILGKHAKQRHLKLATKQNLRSGKAVNNWADTSYVEKKLCKKL